MNKVCLVGRLTFNPDVNEFNYKKVAKFTVAVDRGLSKEAKQNAKQTADFIRCTAWEARAELIEKYVHKGDQVGISGRIQTDSYEDNEGKKVNKTFVLVEHVDLLNNKKEPYQTLSEEDLPF